MQTRLPFTQGYCKATVNRNVALKGCDHISLQLLKRSQGDQEASPVSRHGAQKVGVIGGPSSSTSSGPMPAGPVTPADEQGVPVPAAFFVIEGFLFWLVEAVFTWMHHESVHQSM